MTPGIYFNTPDADYRAWPAVSQSGLKLFRGPYGSPAAYKRALKKPPEQTAAMRFGWLFDLYLLSPELFASKTIDDGGREYRSNADKEWRMLQRAEGREPYKPKELAQIKSMSAVVMAHTEAMGMLARARTQVSIFAHYTFEDGYVLPIKARLDVLPTFHSAIGDVKKTVDATQEGFGKQIQNLGHHIQGSFYRMAYNLVNGADDQRKDFAFIAVQEDAWVDEAGEIYGIGVYPMTDEDFAAGEAILRRDLALYRECVESNKWPGWSKELEWVQRPKWGIAKEKEMERAA